jgi:predicted GNAT superfamily acetyltransferase
VIEYQLIQAPYAEPLLDELHALTCAAFGEFDRTELAWRLAEMPHSTLFVARAGELIAFKLGYAVGRTRYYTWLGGVHPKWRRQGVASTLMDQQHGWLRAQGYGLVETASDPTNVAMLSLNLRAGFRITGTYCRDAGVQRVTLTKTLSS